MAWQATFGRGRGPLEISEGGGIRRVELQLRYDPTFVDLPGATPAAETPDVATGRWV